MPTEKILVVDDEPSVLGLIVDVLVQDGYDAKGTSSSKEALQIIEKGKFDLLLVDVVMPGMDGLELLGRAQGVDPDISTVVMTGYGTVDIAVESLKAGALSFLPKPFSVQELRTVIKDVLEKNRLRRENARLKALMPFFKVSEALMSEVEQDKLFNLIVQTGALETGADRVSLMVLEEATQELVIKAAISLPEEIVGITREKIGKGIAGWVAKTGEPLIIDKEAKGAPFFKRRMKQTGVISAACVPLVTKSKLIGVLNCSKVTGEKPFTQSDLESLSILAGLAANSIENARLFERVTAQRLKHEQLLSQLINAQETERRKLSAEIHDDVSQLMISASYYAQSCAASLLKSQLDEARHEIDRFSNAVGRAIKELRRIMADLYPPNLSEIGLEQVLRHQVDTLQKETGIACYFQVEGIPAQLPPTYEIGIYRIAQEALNNIRKHAAATKLDMRLQFEPNEVSMEIKDNGKGFDLPKVLANQRLSGHFGLLTMKDRVEMLGGSLQIETIPGAGTKLMLTVPVSTKNGNFV